MKLPVETLLADLLADNAWATLGEGNLHLPEVMLDGLLAQLSMPDPMDRVSLICRPGHFLIRVRVDLRSRGVPLTPEVEQVFELEQARIDRIGRFVVLRPRGGLQIVEESLGMSRLPPMAKIIMGRILHTPSLLALVRDRFPRMLSYEHGRLHISLAGVDALDRTITIGEAQVPLLQVLTVKGMRVESGRVVVRLNFDKEALLVALRTPPAPEPGADTPAEGAAEADPTEHRLEPRPQIVPPPQTATETAVRIGLQLGGAGVRFLNRAISRRR